MFDPSAIPGSSLVGRVIRWPLRLVPHGRQVRVLSGPLRGARWIAGAHTHGCRVGTYERTRQDACVRLAKPGMVVYDVGANAGFFALLASRLVGASGAVIAMEPLERNLAFLRAHVKANHSRNVTIVAMAVSNCVGWTTMTAPSSATARIGAGDIKVVTTTLDTMAYEAHGALPGLMKIDVEGAEMDVLEGGQRVLAEARPAIILSTTAVNCARVATRCCAMLDTCWRAKRPASTYALRTRSSRFGEAHREASREDGCHHRFHQGHRPWHRARVRA